MSQKSIRKHSFENKFVVVSNEIAQDKSLTWEERGMILFLQSLPSDWSLYKSTLHNFSENNGDHNTRRIFNDLMAKGYIISRKVKQDGKFFGYEYIFDITKKFEGGFPVEGSPVDGLTVDGKSHTTKEIPTKEIETKQTLNAISDSELKLEFDKFRCMFRGVGKRGLDVEWANFKKRHKNYAEIVPRLVPLYSKYAEWRDYMTAKKEFVPTHKVFSTYINNSCWEEEYGDFVSLGDSEPTDKPDVFFHKPSGKYWKEYSADKKKYVCQKNGDFEYNDNGTKIPFEV